MTRGRVVALFAVMVTAGLASVWAGRGGIAVGPEGRSAMTGSMLLLSNLGNLGFYLCLWPVVFGGTLAEDLATGYSAVLLVRAGTRLRWLMSKVIALAVASAGLLFAVGAVLAVGSFAAAPWGPQQAPIVVTMGDALAARSPLGLAALVLALLTLAGTAVALSSHLIGALGRSPFASQVVAAVGYLIAMLALPTRWNPGDLSTPTVLHAPWATPVWAIGYWVCAFALALVLTYAAIRSKEAR